MKTKIFLFIFGLICFSLQGQQALRKPSFMLLPPESWCYDNKLMLTDESGGSNCDYKRAFQENPNMELLLSRISSFFQDRFNGKFFSLYASEIHSTPKKKICLINCHSS